MSTLAILCPHTHQAKHEFSQSETAATIESCPECHGLIKYCPHCQRANRLAAHYCVECGTQLMVQAKVPSQLLLPGEIRQEAKALSHYSLDNSLQLPEGHRPFMWFSVQEGLLVLTKNQAQKALPLALHFLPDYQFDSDVLLLTEDFPSYTTWIQQPLVSTQGLFVACEDKLQYFPTHGYDSLFAPQYWRPDPGYKILAIALGEDGHPFLLVSDSENNLQLLLGNAQSGQWGNTQINLEKPTNEGGYAIAVGRSVPELCAVYDGNELLLVNLTSKTVQHQLQLKDAVIPPDALFHNRVKAPYFEPFLIGTQTDSLRCIIPVSLSALKAGVVSFQGSQATPVNTSEFKMGSWLLPDPWGVGFIVWSEAAVQRYEGHQPSWQDGGGDFSLVVPLQTPHWFVGQAQEVSSSGYGPETNEIVVFSTRQSEDRYSINLECRPQLSNVEGGKVAGMPPIQSNGRLFIALRDTNDDTVTVYTMQIAR